MIEITDLLFSVKEGKKQSKTLLEIDSMKISKGEFVLIKGETGAGKSTLLSLIGGMNRPTKGEIKVSGKSIVKLSDHFLSRYRREQVGFLFQFFHLIDELTAFDNIAIALIPLNLTQNEISRRVVSAMKTAGIFDKSNSLAKSLSGGERQKCALARGLVHDAPILLADEPTANLDMDAKLRIITLFNDLVSNGKTILVVSHDPLFSQSAKLSQTITLAAGRVT